VRGQLQGHAAEAASASSLATAVDGGGSGSARAMAPSGRQRLSRTAVAAVLLLGAGLFFSESLSIKQYLRDSGASPAYIAHDSHALRAGDGGGAGDRIRTGGAAAARRQALEEEEGAAAADVGLGSEEDAVSQQLQQQQQLIETTDDADRHPAEEAVAADVALTPSSTREPAPPSPDPVVPTPDATATATRSGPPSRTPASTGSGTKTKPPPAAVAPSKTGTPAASPSGSASRAPPSASPSNTASVSGSASLSPTSSLSAAYSPKAGPEQQAYALMRRKLDNPMEDCDPRWAAYLAEYGEFHRKGVEALRRRDPNAPRVVIFECFETPDSSHLVSQDCGGFADRLVGMTHIFMVALLHRYIFFAQWQERERVRALRQGA
jgi:hypothetical protein